MLVLFLSIAVACFALVASILATALVSVHRRHHPRFVLPNAVSIREDLPSLAGITHGELTEGNSVELIENGAYLDSTVALIGSAGQTVHLETFLWRTGAMSARIVAALNDAAAAGVVVRVLVDAVGGRFLSSDEARSLESAGVQLCVLRPIGLRHLGWLHRRTHRKILVADGARAIVGGHCVDDRWLGQGDAPKHFRDVSVFVEGPIVRQIQSAFCENWVEATGSVPYGSAVFPELGPVGSARAHLAYMHPSGGVSAVKLLHHLALCVASERLWIQTPYFLPDQQAREAMVDAVARGVDVRVLMPTIGASDNRLVQRASNHRLAPLIERGVRIYHYGKTLPHQKVWTIDGCYALVGSANFDDRSFDLDDQVTLGIADPAFVREIDERFIADLATARPALPSRWRRRPTTQKLGDALAYLLREQL
jgi:cardiolipin synthase